MNNTIENNKLIAQFMGLTIITDTISFFDTNYKPLKKYHENWSDLMEVVTKIRDIERKAKGDFLRDLLHYKRNNKYIFDVSILEGKEFIYKYVLEFIHWYNQQSK